MRLKSAEGNHLGVCFVQHMSFSLIITLPWIWVDEGRAKSLAIDEDNSQAPCLNTVVLVLGDYEESAYLSLAFLVSGYMHMGMYEYGMCVGGGQKSPSGSSFSIGARYQTQGLMFAWQTLYQLNQLPSSFFGF